MEHLDIENIFIWIQVKIICKANQLATTSRDNACKNKHRVDYDYRVGDKVKHNNHTAYKYETPYKGPFVITQCFTNGMVMLQYGAIQITYNMHWI